MSMFGAGGAKSDNKYYALSQQLLRARESFKQQGYMSLDICELLRIDGMSRIGQEDDAGWLHRRISNALAGCAACEMKFAFVVASTGYETRFYLGAQKGQGKTLAGIFSGVLVDAHISSVGETLKDIAQQGCAGYNRNLPAGIGGYVTGMPCVPAENERFLNPLETIITGMRGTPFTLVCFCETVKQQAVSSMMETLYKEQDAAAQEETYTINSKNLDGRSITMIDYACRHYLDDLDRMKEHISAAFNRGGWKVFSCFVTPDEISTQRLSALISAAYNGVNGGPELIRCHTRMKDINAYIAISAVPVAQGEHLLGRVESGYKNPMCSQLSSDQLASFLMLPDKEVAGFYVNDEARFDLTSRNTYPSGQSIDLGAILQSVYSDDQVGRYPFPYMDFSRHVLIAGATGGGKSNTVRSILKTLYVEKKIPFLVIESAKSEYWQLSAFRGFEKLCVMSLGDMNSPFRLNPFECTPGFSLQTHVDALLSTFKAAFEMYAPMPFILEQAVYEVYRQYGWDVATGQNERRVKQYPKLADLYWQIPETVEGTAYDKEIRDNVTGALQTRVRSLMIGGKGHMMNVRESTPLDRLLELPVVLELESLGDDETKAFVIGLLMNRLYEYRRVSSGGMSRPFEHLLIIEEAHRLLKKVAPSQEGSSAASVEFFCNMLSEIRSYGQGIMIADQSPTKLAQDAIRNTNLKIIHRMVDMDDREAVGGAMHMNDSQREALSMLQRGVGAVYSEGDNRPKLVRFPLIEPERALNRSAVLNQAERLEGSHKGAARYSPRHSGCERCAHWYRGMCQKKSAAEIGRMVALQAQGPKKELQRRDYLEKYHENGPHPRLTDAIIDYGVKRLKESGSAISDDFERSCASGFLAADLFQDDAEMRDLIVVRYCNYLEMQK